MRTAPWWLPRKFKAITLNGEIRVQKDAVLTTKEFRHEGIHAAQQKDFIEKYKSNFIGMTVFYLTYAIQWVWGWRTIFYAYQSIPFEKEAYYFQDDETYLERRKPFAWKYPFEEKITQLNK